MTKKLKPIHPGEILREEFMIPLGLSSNALARAIGVTPARVSHRL
jgi:addiction module HigA family antidote